MGHFLMPTDDMHPIFGNVPTYTTSILSTADLWAQGTLDKFAGGFDARLGNSLRYDSPSFNGLTFSGQVGDCATAPASGGADNGDHPSEAASRVRPRRQRDLQQRPDPGRRVVREQPEGARSPT